MSSPPDPFYLPILRALHVGGGWLAFACAPVALLTPKGGRRHMARRHFGRPTWRPAGEPFRQAI